MSSSEFRHYTRDEFLAEFYPDPADKAAIAAGMEQVHAEQGAFAPSAALSGIPRHWLTIGGPDHVRSAKTRLRQSGQALYPGYPCALNPQAAPDLAVAPSRRARNFQPRPRHDGHRFLPLAGIGRSHALPYPVAATPPQGGCRQIATLRSAKRDHPNSQSG